MNEGTMDDPRNGGTHEGGARRGEFRLQRNSLHQQVVERLRDMIVEGELAPGRRIPEAELCESFGISRTPLREALRVLDSEGLVEPDGTRGSRVTKITTREIAELFEVVSGIERMAAELAAERMTDADVENLRAITLRMEQHFQRGDRQKYFRLNQVIHHTIVKLAGNGILASTHAGLMNKVRRARYFAILSQDRWRESVDEHNEIVRAFAERDAERAGRLLLTHVRKTGIIVETTFEPGLGRPGNPPLYSDE